LNVSLIGFETYVGHHYVPKWTEFSVTLMIIALGFALFRVAVQYLPIFPKDDHVAQRVSQAHSSVALAAPVLEHAGD
jgi:Ni/Fe-hydrogenase subunit HybB-like protein